jgi:hypothetical protein
MRNVNRAEITRPLHWTATFGPSVPADAAWTPARTKTAKLAECTARHSRLGRRRMVSDVISMATKR